ncbi:MAG: hypothetical protein HC842_00145 [Cytophagales bacterium]|nr:hypothetical protein [Cytophagales bacterium]
MDYLSIDSPNDVEDYRVSRLITSYSRYMKLVRYGLDRDQAKEMTDLQEEEKFTQARSHYYNNKAKETVLA